MVEFLDKAFADLTDQMEDGPNKILDAAREAGIPQSTIDEISPVLGVSLGYAPVAPIDMANAYATLASGPTGLSSNKSIHAVAEASTSTTSPQCSQSMKRSLPILWPPCRRWFDLALESQAGRSVRLRERPVRLRPAVVMTVECLPRGLSVQHRNSRLQLCTTAEKETKNSKAT